MTFSFFRIKVRSNRCKKNLSGHDALRETTSPAGSRRKVSFTGHRLTGYELQSSLPREPGNSFTFRADQHDHRTSASAGAHALRWAGVKPTLKDRKDIWQLIHRQPILAVRYALDECDEEFGGAAAPRQLHFPSSSWPRLDAALRTHPTFLNRLVRTSTPRQQRSRLALALRVELCRRNTLRGNRLLLLRIPRSLHIHNDEWLISTF
ncbi:MAG TPA: hypothetical protein VFB96_12270 [Pirellulaceae bacterium]|nr:hypothetical protein [Pirellulaceae bacterium]